MYRLFLIVSIAIVPAFSQNYPAFRWIRALAGSGADTVAGIAVDALGNTYVAGSTTSRDFPVHAAAQSKPASGGVVRIDATGTTPLGLSSALAIAFDPNHPNILYAADGVAAERSSDGGNTWAPLPVPSSNVTAIAVSPSDGRAIWAGTSTGVFKSTDGGASWSPTSAQSYIRRIWIGPRNGNVLFAATGSGLIRSGDAGATWQTVIPNIIPYDVSFDAANPDAVYVTDLIKPMKSADSGVTWASLGPQAVNGYETIYSVLADPSRSGRLILATGTGLYESTDGGSTWTRRSSVQVTGPMAADWADDALYAFVFPARLVRISADLNTVTPAGPGTLPPVAQIIVRGSSVYLGVQASSDVFVAKLDAGGNIVYATYFGGVADDFAGGIAVDAAGNAYVTGNTASQDFPVTADAFAGTPPTENGTHIGASFLFKLAPDGSVVYSTYFSTARSTPNAIAVNAADEVYLAGTSLGGLPTTAGSYQPAFSGTAVPGFMAPVFPPANAFLSKFDARGATLEFSTYIGTQSSSANALSLAPDGSAFVGGSTTLYHMDASGATLLQTAESLASSVQALATAPDGSLYLAGALVGLFAPTPGAFQPSTNGVLAASGYAVVTRLDPEFNVLAATLLGGGYGDSPNALAVAAAGNVFVAGWTSPRGFPTRLPLQEGFGPMAGFLSELSPNLTDLLFSTYLGDAETFTATAVAALPDGSAVVAGTTGIGVNQIPGPVHSYVNRVSTGVPPPLQVDAVLNAASMLDGQISEGEGIVVRGAGFTNDSHVSIGGYRVPSYSSSSTSITVTVPPLTGATAIVQVESGGATSNQVLAAVGVSPGLFSADGSGTGQGYILNSDATLNSPTNPAKMGDIITIFATGVGPYSLDGPYAVSASTPEVYIDGFYANGVAAVAGSVDGYPGSTYQLRVIVPDPAQYANLNPNLTGFQMPPQAPVVLKVNGGTSQRGLTLSVAH